MNLPSSDTWADEDEDPTQPLAAEESDPLKPPVPFDPSTIGFPVMLPVELALAEDTPRAICESYAIDRDRFADILRNPAFQKAFLDAKEMLLKEGMSYRMKARMQAEELLKTSWRMIHDPFVAANVRADLIKHTAKVAGYEPSPAAGANAGILAGGALQININLG